jgi:hypothetical protein
MKKYIFYSFISLSLLFACVGLRDRDSRMRETYTLIERSIVAANDFDTTANEFFFIHFEYIHFRATEESVKLDSNYVAKIIAGKARDMKDRISQLVTAVVVDGRLTGICTADKGYRIYDDEIFYNLTKPLVKHLYSMKISYAYSLCTHPKLSNGLVYFFFDANEMYLSMNNGYRDCVILPFNHAMSTYREAITDKIWHYW